ncbi:MAG: OmpH family outer membrane protein [Parachlamydiales bacterium]|nr:OmpH family outer membrane protein [Parachlamydiales bacterium]
MLLRLICSAAALMLSFNVFAADSAIVDFIACIQNSKYGQYENEQLESIHGQWASLIEETDKEIKTMQDKLQDQEYLDGLSADGEKELKMKMQNLVNDKIKYQNQLYQILQHAQYFIIQQISEQITKAAEQLASQKKFDILVRKDHTLYHKPHLEITESVITIMDQNFANDKSLSENSIKNQFPLPPKGIDTNATEEVKK